MQEVRDSVRRVLGMLTELRATRASAGGVAPLTSGADAPRIAHRPERAQSLRSAAELWQAPSAPRPEAPAPPPEVALPTWAAPAPEVVPPVSLGVPWRRPGMKTVAH